MDVMENHNIVTERQWAYRKGHSTELLLIKLTEEWTSELENGNFIATTFIDFQKAFDSIPHSVLLKKKKKYCKPSGLRETYITGSRTI